MNQQEQQPADAQVRQEAAGEEILWQGHPSRWRYCGRLGLGALMLVAGLVLSVVLRDNRYALAAALVLAAAGAAVLSWAHLDRTRTRLTVTRRTVSFERGILSREAVDLPLRSISEMWVEQSFLGRILGLGTIGFSSSASDATEIVCAGMPHPQRIRQVVLQLTER
jgi:uncharacterized membrane protein YdbT with pleckstrin-like domain